MSATILPPATAESRWLRLRAPVLLAAGILGTSLLLHVRDPHQAGSWGFCPWLVLTGQFCPGCGGLRAVNDLTHGNFGAAASSNLMFVTSIPLALILWGRWFGDRWHGVQRRMSTRMVFVCSGVFLSVAVTFWVLRNLSFGAWLAP